VFNVCPGCGDYGEEKLIASDGRHAVCQACGHEHPFVRLPLLIVTGASGTGKSTVLLKLVAEQSAFVCLDSDILWRDEFSKPENDFRDYRNLWLRVAKNIAQNGRPVVLFGSATPGQFEQCAESRYFSGIHYLALVCSDNELTRRLKARPVWRNSGTEAVLEQMTKFNRWLIDNAANSNPPMSLLDTSTITLEESIEATKKWIASCQKISVSPH
jgi:hypothetical protein